MIYYKWKPGAVARARGRLFMSQEQLARNSEVSAQTISRVERGETVQAQRRTVLQIARALDVHPSVLVEEIEEEEPVDVPRFPQALAAFL